MAREIDLNWFESNRSKLAEEMPRQWLVIYQGKPIKSFPTEEEAINYSIGEFGINLASVFQVLKEDPLVYIG